METKNKTQTQTQTQVKDIEMMTKTQLKRALMSCKKELIEMEKTALKAESVMIKYHNDDRDMWNEYNKEEEENAY